jgi:menaquinone-dependent protoporphyrinogen oxidase
MNVLIAYATRYGATREVAESIAVVLRERMLHAEVREARHVDDIEGYDAVVLGGGMYTGRWHRDARRFARDFAVDLDAMPVAVFALGPVDDDPEHVAGSEKQWYAALGKLRFEPVAASLFGGVIDPAKLHFPFNHMPPSDARDWTAIREWALQLSDELAGAALQTGR